MCVPLLSHRWVHCIYSLCNYLGWIQLMAPWITAAWTVLGSGASPTAVAGWSSADFHCCLEFCACFLALVPFSKCSSSFDVSRSWWGVILLKETGKELQLPYLLFSLSARWLSPLSYSWHQVFITFNSLPLCFPSIILHFQEWRDCKPTASRHQRNPASSLYLSVMLSSRPFLGRLF